MWHRIDDPDHPPPKDGTLVRLRSENYTPTDCFFWNKPNRRWETHVFALARKCVGWLDSALEQPTHWKPAEDTP